MKRKLFTHAHLVIDGNKEYLDGALLVNGEIIEDVFFNSNMLNKDLSEYEEIDLQGKIVMPGFFDTHVHGSGGIDFKNCTKEDLEKAATSFLKHGTTSFFTSLTNNDRLYEQLDIFENTETNSSRFLGVHLEGPFINSDSRGVLLADTILDCDVKKLDEILKHSTKIKQMTVAPEKDNAKELIEEINNRGINVMFGHSKALYKDTIDKKYNGFTHLLNAMSGFSHRDLGLVNTALIEDDKYAELICDGKHIDETVLKIMLKNLRRDRIVMISDSTKMAGLPDGDFMFEGEETYKEGIVCLRKKDKRIAGGAAFISDGVKIMRKQGASLTDLLLMTSLNAYRLYGLDKRFGSLMKGKYSDIVILDDELNIKGVYARGELHNA